MAENTDPKPIESLYEAALQGDVSLLQELLGRDPFLLHRPLPPWQSNTWPLHVACKLGHTSFMLELLHRDPILVEEQDPNDKSSVLHLAARYGHLELVKYVLLCNPGLCFARDVAGRNPVHVAAITNQLHVLEELLRATPAAARERVGLPSNGGGDTILHLCVKYNKPEALKLTVRMVGGVTQLLNATDVDGNTILHLAVANKNLEIVEFLLKEERLKKSSQNSDGFTAKDVLDEITKAIDNNVDFGLKAALKRARVPSSKHIKKDTERDKYYKRIEKQRSTLMVVASLIATMAFQAGLNPPGGVFPSPDKEQVIAPPPVSSYDRERTDYHVFFVSNTIGFMLSMISILMLISGLPCRRFSMALIMVTMWAAVAVIAFTYGFSSFILLSGDDFTEARFYYTYPWMVVIGLLLLGHFIQWPWRFIKYLCSRKKKSAH